MKLVVVGLNWKTASQEILEKFAIPENGMGMALAGMMELEPVKECAIISTCNRTEIYTVSDDAYESFRSTKEYLARYNSQTVDEIDGYLYAYRGLDAIRHLFRVASGIDSLVLGEPQIAGQVKDAYEYSLKFNASGQFLNRLFPKTISVVKKVRTETAIGSGAVSVSSAAVDLVKKIISQLDEKAAMVIGAGEMGGLAARHLVSAGIKDIMVTNRTFDRAVKLSDELQGCAVRFEEFTSRLKLADVVISATGASGYIITKEDAVNVIKQRANKFWVLIDIAHPADIDPACHEVENVFVYNIFDLRSVVEENLDERKKEAEKAENIIAVEVDQFFKWFETYRAAPIIVELRNKFDELREKEVEKALSQLKDADEKTQKTIMAMANSLMNKFLHQPINALKQGENLDDGTNAGEAVRKIFDLGDGDEVSISDEKESVES
jgi:glutamyl-tRNA reductase